MVLEAFLESLEPRATATAEWGESRIVQVQDAFDPEGWEERVEFVPFDEVRLQDFEPVHRVFVDAALERFA